MFLQYITISYFLHICCDEVNYVTTCAEAADGIAITVLGPELRTALLESWSYVMNEMQSIVTHLQIVKEQPQPESERSSVIFRRWKASRKPATVVLVLVVVLLVTVFEKCLRLC